MTCTRKIMTAATPRNTSVDLRRFFWIMSRIISAIPAKAAIMGIAAIIIITKGPRVLLSVKTGPPKFVIMPPVYQNKITN